MEYLLSCVELLLVEHAGVACESHECVGSTLQYNEEGNRVVSYLSVSDIYVCRNLIDNLCSIYDTCLHRIGV